MKETKSIKSNLEQKMKDMGFGDLLESGHVSISYGLGPKKKEDEN